VSQYSHLTADLANENSSISKIARLVGHDRTVLDVGCAHGYLAEVLRAQGCRVVGIERDPEDAARARQHCEEVVVTDLDTPAWADALGGRRFDVIVFADVLEHLRDPAAVVRRARDLLHPERGVIVASIPNVAHVSVRLELFLGSFRRETLGILDATHLHFYTRESLEEMLAGAGVAVERWDCTTNDVADPVVAEYLARAGVPDTPALRDAFGRFEARAYQFVILARPADSTAGARGASPLEKPLARTARLRAGDVDAPRAGGLRVLQVIHQFLPRHTGGTEIYCSDLAFALARRGHAVRVLTGAPWREDAGTSRQLEGDATIAVDGVPAGRAYRALGPVAFFFDRFDNPEARVAARGILETMRPDVVHVQQLLYLSGEVIRECRRRGIPVVVTLHDYWFMCHRVRLLRRDGRLCEGPAGGWNCAQCLNVPPLVRSRLNPVAAGANVYRVRYLRRRLCEADRILSPSRFVRDAFERNGFPAGRIAVSALGIPEPPPELVARFAARETHTPVRFGFLGTLMPEKGVGVLLEAFASLPPGLAELHVYGVPVDAGFEAAMRERARHQDIRWHAAVPHAERWRALAEVDVLVVPSTWYENSPLTVHEALMARLPVIGSAIGGIPEFVRHDSTGLLFPPGDAPALAACLRQVATDPARIEGWRRAIQPPKTMAAHVDEIETLYRALVAERAAQAAGA
jgi:glycosyltransferase involved in cell wall biosynthesis/2-polyprenyl-3-methyl-5-hydroxy-6-metoxy-1,4-benzoquinol methylase